LLDLKQSKLSYHLKKLVDAQILILEKHGTWNYYKINEAHIQVVLTEDTCCNIL
ncbi:MAG: ArsR family transcriptional regulator, partial [Staphylococcus equorum]|nr:ArsR family transcriptional regulator [Staphylococcus equorum]